MARFSDEVMAQVNKVNVIEYAIHEGYDVLKKGRDYKIKDGSGFILEQNGEKWNRTSDQSKGAGGGIVQFVMYTKEKSWVDAVKDLIAYGNIQHEPSGAVATFKKTFKPKVVEKVDFKPPKKNTTVKHVYSYLINTRKIDKDILACYTNRNLIYEDDHRNCVFCCFDEKGVMKNASLRGTYDTKGDPFKGMPEGSDKIYPFAFPGKGNKVFVFEAPIDLMSFQTMQKRFGDLDQQKGDHYIALNGVISGPLIHYLEGHKNIDKVIFCLDNDLAGTMNTACLSNILDEKYPQKYKIEMRVPEEGEKDWNNSLVRMTNKADEVVNQREVEGDWDREQ
ncbi:DUF3991 domain-containing protein [Acetobacterium sp.]|uniref:DUF3991 domain-containing protein n=1 Tax=Acetobacterium sp. TaxID=1872094 RepID=UPI002F414E9E